MNWNAKGMLSPGGQINQGHRNSMVPAKASTGQVPGWERTPPPSSLCSRLCQHTCRLTMGRTHALTWFFSWTEQKALRRSLMMDK